MRNISLCLLITLLTQNLSAQKKDANPWVLGIGVNIINDSGEILSGLFNLSENYHYKNPISASIEKRFALNHGFEVLFSNNTFLTGKRVNGQILTEDRSFMAFDGHYKNYISNLWQNTYRAIYEGYFLIGSGMTIIEDKNSITGNLGLGINWFLTEQMRLSTQAIGKVGLQANQGSASNYIQFNIGLIFRLQDSDNCGCFL
ncbi:MAG: hypothetical protein CL613_05590 [Aquimarina sp.]|nr:hypothetical protein [Aquimarina sp.]